MTAAGTKTIVYILVAAVLLLLPLALPYALSGVFPQWAISYSPFTGRTMDVIADDRSLWPEFMAESARRSSFQRRSILNGFDSGRASVRVLAASSLPVFVGDLTVEDVDRMCRIAQNDVEVKATLFFSAAYLNETIGVGVPAISRILDHLGR
jgi:hypothetical protein